MQNLEILHFEQLKTEIQAKYLEEHTPSQEDISQWKGIDIIYFQEDLRKKAKGNISEKTFYTYFKSSPVSKLPRIDMLNILSIYAGYTSWFDFKKNHLFANEVLSETEEIESAKEVLIAEKAADSIPTHPESEKESKLAEITAINTVLQNTNTDNQYIKAIPVETETVKNILVRKPNRKVFNYIWVGITSILVLATTFLGFGDKIFSKNYSYCFIDSDRNETVQSALDIKVLKENESPLHFRVNAGECFHYSTQDKILKMEISSPLYENLSISRNLEDAPDEEKIQLKPDDYKTAVYYFSRKSVSSDPLLIKQKRRELENRISDDATILQLFDNDVYGIETMDKQKYINLVTTPTTSLKNLTVIEMKREKGKIVSIKFKIKEDESDK